MSIIINKPGQTINDVSYGFLQVELNPFIELHYDRVSVNTKCYDGLDASMFGLEGYWDSSTELIPESSYYVDVWVDDPSGHWDSSVWVEDSSGYWDASLVTVPEYITDISIFIDPISPIIPVDWDRFNPIKIPFELEASTNLEEWAHEKCVEELTTAKLLPYEYMAYETDVYDLDPSSGDPMLDPCTNQPIVLHSQGELIKKANGTYMFYTKILPIFCELEDVSIKL